MGKKRVETSRILTGKEVQFAAINKLPVYYIEKYHNPYDKHKNFKGKCVMEPAIASGYYIGNSDIEPDNFGADELVIGNFDEGNFEVKSIPGIKYK